MLTRFLRLWVFAFALVLIAPQSEARGKTCEAGECPNPDVVSDAEPTPEDPRCPSRAHVIQCAGKYLDTNQNGYLEREELQGAIDSLPWYGRGILKILGSVDKMMTKCDIDGDGKIGIDYDMQNNQETCLATCFKRRAFKQSFFPECDL